MGSARITSPHFIEDRTTELALHSVGGFCLRLRSRTRYSARSLARGRERNRSLFGEAAWPACSMDWSRRLSKNHLGSS